MKNSLKMLLKEKPLNAIATIIKQLENAGLIKVGEKVSFEIPLAIQNAIHEGVDIGDLGNLAKILNLTISGEPEQVLYIFVLKTETNQYEVPITALEFLRQSKSINESI